jgi:DNA-binding transcriptional ArsR family regulator
MPASYPLPEHPVLNQLVDNLALRGLVFNQLVDKEVVMEDSLSRVFSALADPTRRDLVARLTSGDATLTELASAYDVSVQAVSKHLKVLEDAGLVRRSKVAQSRPCHLEAEVLDLMTGWIERRRREVEERYQRLDQVLDELAAEDDPATQEQLEGEAS